MFDTPERHAPWSTLRNRRQGKRLVIPTSWFNKMYDISTGVLWRHVLPVVLLMLAYGTDVFGQSAIRPIVVEDFQGYRGGDSPYTWKRAHRSSRSFVQVPRELDRDRDYFEIVDEGGNMVARVYTQDESTQIVKLNGEGYQWDVRHHPRLTWDWRATQLPTGAREDMGKLNDTGAAVYVTFGTDWLGRPRSIKYTYSSSLPVGTTHKYGPLRVIVASSAADGLGDWVHVVRDVRADYSEVFGGNPPDEPLSITLWSDSDDTKSVSEAYFDNLELHPAE